MKVPLKGIIHVTGESDTGKTTFALQCGAKIPRIAFFDADVKGSGVVDNLREQGVRFGEYHDLTSECKGMRETAMHEHCLALLDNLSKRKGKFDALVWDNFSPFERTFHPFVTKHPLKFKEKYSPMGQIKGAEIWLASFDYEAQVLAYMTTLAPLVILTTHLKGHNINGKRTGKLVPDEKRPLVRKSTMRLWLRHNPNSAVPIGLVLKRIGKDVVLDDGTYDKVNVLPRRLVPWPDDAGLWDTIARYWVNPMGNRAPTKEETPNDFELSILDGTLTEDQKMIFQQGKADDEDMLDLSDPTSDVLRLDSEGMSVPNIAKELGLKKERVIDILDEYGG